MAGWWLEPDLTGRRLALIRSARRGAELAVLTFGPIAILGAARLPADNDLPAVVLGPLAWPALALLGAGLTETALGDRWEGVLAGLAAAAAMPIAAVTSFVIGAFVVGAILSGLDGAILGGLDGGVTLAGRAFHEGLRAAIGVAPLTLLAGAAWVGLVRRFARRDPRPVAAAVDIRVWSTSANPSERAEQDATDTEP